MKRLVSELVFQRSSRKGEGSLELMQRYVFPWFLVHLSFFFLCRVYNILADVHYKRKTRLEKQQQLEISKERDWGEKGASPCLCDPARGHGNSRFRPGLPHSRSIKSNGSEGARTSLLFQKIHRRK